MTAEMGVKHDETAEVLNLSNIVKHGEPGMLRRDPLAFARKSLSAILVLWLLGWPLGAVARDRPNVLIILADDLGFSDLGCYGGEIETPNLDRLAKGGLRFTDFYNTARCWPTRAALLTGYYAQQVRRDTVAGVPSGARGKRPAWARLLPSMLQPLGYRTYHSGKWHVDGMPCAGGFDRSYYLQDQGRFFNPRVHYENDRRLPPVKPDSGYYATTAIADHAIEYLKEHARRYGDKPFFDYVAFTAPHFPLQAPAEDIARYRERYRRGWKVIREKRWGRVQALGIVEGALSPVERDLGPPYDFPKALRTLGDGEVNRPLPWEDLTEKQRTFQAAKMAIHAAMVDRLDRETGRVLDQLRRMGVFDDTLIFFLSDNGASAEIMVRDDGHDPTAPPGSARTHLCLGPGWSTVSNTPFRRHKTWVHEGGIATPLIVHWTNGIAARGELRRNPGHVIDLVPTILEIAGGKRPAVADGVQAPPPPGKSLVPAFEQDGSVGRASLWWLHEGNRAIRVGRWKLVAARGDPWELYDLRSDRTETVNLAARRPGKVHELEKLWQQQTDAFRANALGDSTQKKPSVPELLLATDLDVRPAVEQAVEDFSRDSGCRVRAVWVDLGAAASQLRKADAILWQGERQGDADFRQLLEPGSEKVLGSKRLAILTRQGNPKGIERLSDLARADVRVALAAPAWKPLRRETDAVLRRAGLAGKIDGNTTSPFTSPEPLVRAIRKGSIDAALGWSVFEGLEADGIDATLLPEDVAASVSIRAAVARRSGHKPQARSLVTFLSSVVGQAVLGRYGYHVELHHAGARAYDALVESRLARTYPLTAMRLVNESGISRGTCLDVGCGTGQLEVALARISELKIVGVDIDPEMIRIARRRIREAGLSDRVRFMLGDVHELPFVDRCADLVVSRGSLLFWKDKIKALREIRRVLKPSGFALVGGRYLYTPPRFKLSDDELRSIAARTEIRDIRVDTFRGQWIRIGRPRSSGREPRAPGGPRMLAGRCVVDYGVTRGRCLLLGRDVRTLGELLKGLGKSTRLEVAALLPSAAAVAQAKKALPGTVEAGRVTYRSGGIEALPFPKASFDLVVGAGPMLIFARNKESALRELHRVLRPGGAALVGGRYLGMPEFRKVPSESLRRIAAGTALPGIRVIDDGGQWVEIRKPRGKKAPGT